MNIINEFTMKIAIWSICLFGCFLIILLTIFMMTPKISIQSNMPACENISTLPDKTSYQCIDAYNDKIRQYRASYDRWSLMNRASSLAWQHVSSVLFFILFSGVLIFGLYLTYHEFTKETKQAVNLKIGNSGFEVTSEIVGVVILVISLAFTYLYVDRVYPIKEIGQKQAAKK